MLVSFRTSDMPTIGYFGIYCLVRIEFPFCSLVVSIVERM